MRRWLERLGPDRSLEHLNSLSKEQDLRTASGLPVRFVPPGKADAYYEVQLFRTGQVQTRTGNLHDLFNALAWLLEGATGFYEELRHNDLGLPEEFWVHAQAAQRETLLAARAAIDTLIEKVNAAERAEQERQQRRERRGGVDIEF